MEGENVLIHYCGGKGTEPAIPCSIVRLGIVSPVCKGEHLGWFMGNGGFVFLVIGIATGNIRYLYGDGLGKPDFVPVDYTVDTILSVTANTVHSEDKCAIYQCGVIANAPKWNVDCCVQYIRPKFIERDLLKPNDLLKVRVGEWDASGFKSPEQFDHAEYTVVRILKHPQFNANRLDNDLAILYTDRDINLNNPNVNTACLPSCDNQFDFLFSNGTGVRCHVAGWGKDEVDGQFQ